MDASWPDVLWPDVSWKDISWPDILWPDVLWPDVLRVYSVRGQRGHRASRSSSARSQAALAVHRSGVKKYTELVGLPLCSRHTHRTTVHRLGVKKLKKPGDLHQPALTVRGQSKNATGSSI